MYYKNKASLGGVILFFSRLLFIAGLTSCALHAAANHGNEYTVVISQGCPYIMAEGLDSQFLARVTHGDIPSLGDTLAGTLRRSGNIELQNLTRNGSIQLEIELVETLTGTRGAVRYSQLCPF